MMNFSVIDFLIDSLVEQLQSLKRKNPKLILLYSILGSWKADHVNLLRNDEQRDAFNERISQFLVENRFDGLGK